MDRYHCVTQLWETSWEYRKKAEGEAREVDDLVAADDVARALLAICYAPKEAAQKMVQELYDELECK